MVDLAPGELSRLEFLGDRWCRLWLLVDPLAAFRDPVLCVWGENWDAHEPELDDMEDDGDMVGEAVPILYWLLWLSPRLICWNDGENVATEFGGGEFGAGPEDGIPK